MPNAPSLSLPVLTVFSLYIILICLVAAVLYVAVNKLEPNRHYASVIKLLIVAVAVAAIFNQLARSSLRKKSSPQPARGTHAITGTRSGAETSKVFLGFPDFPFPA
jgi:branched-subunit amino acid ABC-type transport system permease component